MLVRCSAHAHARCLISVADVRRASPCVFSLLMVLSLLIADCLPPVVAYGYHHQQPPPPQPPPPDGSTYLNPNYSNNIQHHHHQQQQQQRSSSSSSDSSSSSSRIANPRSNSHGVSPSNKRNSAHLVSSSSVQSIYRRTTKFRLKRVSGILNLDAEATRRSMPAQLRLQLSGSGVGGERGEEERERDRQKENAGENPAPKGTIENRSSVHTVSTRNNKSATSSSPTASISSSSSSSSSSPSSYSRYHHSNNNNNNNKPKTSDSSSSSSSSSSSPSSSSMSCPGLQQQFFPSSRMCDTLKSADQCLTLTPFLAKAVCQHCQASERDALIRKAGLRFCTSFDAVSVSPCASVSSDDGNRHCPLHGDLRECQAYMDDMMEQDRQAEQLYQGFLELMSRFDCEDRYSVKWTCKNCKQAYKDWLCSQKIQFFRSGRLIPPCNEFCTHVEKMCPFFRPKIETHAGDPSFICKDPDINLPSSSEQRGCYRLCHLWSSSDISQFYCSPGHLKGAPCPLTTNCYSLDDFTEAPPLSSANDSHSASTYSISSTSTSNTDTDFSNSVGISTHANNNNGTTSGAASLHSSSFLVFTSRWCCGRRMAAEVTLPMTLIVIAWLTLSLCSFHPTRLRLGLT